MLLSSGGVEFYLLQKQLRCRCHYGKLNLSTGDREQAEVSADAALQGRKYIKLHTR